VRRTQLQLDELTYQEIRRRAFRSGKSMARVMRELLQQALAADRVTPDERWEKALEIVGKYEDQPGEEVSARHDEYLDEAFSR
jgi:plasmid stability protein